TSSTEQPPLKDKSMWSDQEKRIQKIDHLGRNMLGSEYGKQDRKAAVLYEYETFKATEGELLLDTYIRYLQVINDLKKCGYSKYNCELNFKFLNNLQPEWKQYATLMRQNKNLMDINIDALYNILKQNQGDVNAAIGSKRKTVMVTSDPLALIAEKTKPTNNNLRTSSTSQSANKKQEFVKSDDKQVVKKADEKKRDELEENLVTYSPDFQNTSEPSNASTNVVNAPREPNVVKQGNGSFVNEIIFDLNRAPDSPNQFHCFHCKDVLKDGETCKRCTCAKCGSGLSKGLCYICGHNQNSLNDSPRISETSPQSPPNINQCCYECGDPLDGIFCKRCTCKSCGKDAHTGYNCPSKVPVISIPEPCNNQTINELPQALPNFHPTFHSEAESRFTLDLTPTYVDESPNVFSPPPQPPVHTY
nr:hypothetical protein [Tanacetum cinerariifolium]